MLFRNLLPSGHSYRGILGNVAWLGAVGLAVKPVWFLFIAMACVRYLGATNYGILTTAISLAAIASAFTSLGVVQFLVREVARDRSSASRFFSNFLPVQFALGIAAGVAAVAAGVSLDYSPIMLWSVAFASIYMAGLSLTMFGRSFFRAFEVLKHEAISTVAEKALVIAAGLVLLVSTRMPHWTLLGMAIGMTLTATGTLRWVHLRQAAFRVKSVSSRFLATTLRDNIPFALLSLFGIIYFRIDTVMVEAYLGATAAGHYGLAYRIVEALNMLPLVVAHSAIYPRLSALQAQGEHVAARRLVNAGLGWLVVLSVTITSLVVVLASPIIDVLANDASMAPAADVLRFLTLTFPLACITSVLYIALLSRNRQRTVTTFLGLTTLLNVAFNLFAIPRMGIVGAAVATVICELILVAVYGAAYLRGSNGNSGPNVLDS